MIQQFLFDVDGTLTPSRGRINEEFRLFMIEFCRKYDCYIVTGSDQQKTVEQLGGYLYDRFKQQHQCSGNQIFENTITKVYESEWTLPTEVREYLEQCVKNSIFPFKKGVHIEDRPGMVNFSIPGRGIDELGRREYVHWDNNLGERVALAAQINNKFKHLNINAQIGGETGLDITPIGFDKSQTLNGIKGEVAFFGDACQEGGNDYPLAKAILEKNQGTVYNVRDWNETYEILREIDNAIPSIR